ncbi:nucleolar transcription factor 1-like [Cyprinodon tularosa]|uniref:nucleolar transcription factor 1-like n=1 Tax=Cyprinodon tularosa TaxID=77115 RepID=UPI0018E265FA|nr:nucleolar transcription factor 1-like [Cyprinodon tularosa]
MYKINEEDVDSDADSDTLTPEWTQKNLKQLIASLKEHLPTGRRPETYIREMKAVDWHKVAFSPFSAEECQEKWNSIMVKMRRYRTLPELLDEAEALLSHPVNYKTIHSELPKLPVNPKMKYIAKEMSNCKNNHPELSCPEITKLLAKKYDSLPDEEKAEYVRKHSLELSEYNKKKHDFCISNKLRLPMKRSWKRRSNKNGGEGCSKDEELPEKPPPHGRALFLKEFSKASGPSLGANFLKTSSQRWREMSKKEKQKYNSRCDEMKKEYKNKLLKYLDQLDVEERQRIIKEKNIKVPKATLGHYVKMPGEPKMPTHSRFIYFHKEQVKYIDKALKGKDQIQMIKKQWHELPESERKRYTKIIKEDMRKYKEDLKQWFQTLSPKEQKDYLKRKPRKQQYLKQSLSIKERNLKLPSDSEDEDIVLSGDEEENLIESEVEESEEEECSDMFDMYD